LKLIGMLDSPYVRRVAISLQLLGLRFTHQSLSVFRTYDQFRAINPVSLSPEEITTTNPLKIGDSLSTAPHGFTMQVTFTAPEASFTIQDDELVPTWSFKIEPDGGFLVDDILYVSSDYTNKQTYIIRDSVVIFMADKVYPGSRWPVVFPGDNTFYLPEMGSFDWESLDFYAAYWGV
jgi:hypothetical protein